MTTAQGPQEEPISDEADVARLIANDRPSVFLSASVPAPRKFPAEIKADERDANARYLATLNAPLIRAAVAAFAREAVRRDLRIVFGAHPAISPMLLTALRDADKGQILIFQSDFFRGKFPKSTQALAEWSRGRLLVTKPQKSSAAPPGASPEFEEWLDRKASLTFMRKCMVKVSGLEAAVVIGGMDGAEEEAALFTQYNPAARCYAYGGSGSAALELLKSSPGTYSGGVSLDILSDDLSPSLVMREIFADFAPTRGSAIAP